MQQKELKDYYKNTLTEIMKIEEKIKELETKEDVKEYKSLTSNLRTKRADLEGLKKAIDYSIMNECNHLYVLSKEKFPDVRYGIPDRYYPCCIKCGLDTSVATKYYDELNQKQKTMQLILGKNDGLPKGRYLKDDDNYTIDCPSSSLAEELYKEIIRDNPSISDDDTEIMFREKLKQRQKVKYKNR